jgi:hypothetical protein
VVFCDLLNSVLGVADEVEELVLENVGVSLLSLFKRVESVENLCVLLDTSFAYKN